MNIDIKIDDITPDLLNSFIEADRKSSTKLFMAEADKYMNVENTEISNRRKMMMLLDDNDKPYTKPDYSKANNKAKHSYLQELINQCTNYLAGKPMKIDYKKAFDKIGNNDKNDPSNDIDLQKEGVQTQADLDKELINDELYKNNNFLSFIQDNIDNTQLYGKTYMRIVRDGDNNKFVTYNPKEIIMFYDNFDEPILCIRYFTKPELVETGKGRNVKKELKDVEYAEVYNKTHKDTYKIGKKGYELVGEREAVYFNKIVFKEKEVVKTEAIETNVFPIIEWKFNKNAIPTLINIKDFIDLQDTNLSDLANNIEDIQEAIWILENYNGQNIKEFLDDLKEKKAIKVGAGGSAKSETVDIPIEARTKLYEMCAKNIYKFGFGIDFSERDSLGNVSGVALKWSYAPLEQKANAIENNAHEALNKFFNILFMLMGLPYDSNDLEFLFDRTMIANEQEQTATIMSASSVLSQKTVLDNLPMVSDTEDELEKLEGENEYEPTIPKETFETGEEDEEEDDDGDENTPKLSDNPITRK